MRGRPRGDPAARSADPHAGALEPARHLDAHDRHRLDRRFHRLLPGGIHRGSAEGRDRPGRAGDRRRRGRGAERGHAADLRVPAVPRVQRREARSVPALDRLHLPGGPKQKAAAGAHAGSERAHRKAARGDRRRRSGDPNLCGAARRHAVYNRLFFDAHRKIRRPRPSVAEPARVRHHGLHPGGIRPGARKGADGKV